jgi:hypothetical protein
MLLVALSAKPIRAQIAVEEQENVFAARQSLRPEEGGSAERKPCGGQRQRRRWFAGRSRWR